MHHLIKYFYTILLFLFFIAPTKAKEVFPDGTTIPKWFQENHSLPIEKLGKRYIITDYSIANDSTLLQTEQIQHVIDKAAYEGGGVIVIPKGTFLTSSLFFKQGTHLYLEDGAILKGSDDISHFPVVETRVEGQTLNYFAALINADGINGFSISGKGTINGNGLRYWKSFWQRRAVNPDCTNMDELRPRLVYISNCKNVQISGINLINSPFWTTHFYKCEYVKLLNLYIYSPHSPVKAPSTDAIDIDACQNLLIKDCYMAVNDDAIALKGGKGPKADLDPNNGSNINIIIEDCTFGFCHSALTFGSESIYDRNIIMRRCTIEEQAQRLLWLKMRPDTPQHYEYIAVEDIKGNAINFLYIQPWTQFFDMKGENNMPISRANHVSMRNIDLECENIFNVGISEQYELSDFLLENLRIHATKNSKIEKEYIKNLTLENITINNKVIY